MAVCPRVATRWQDGTGIRSGCCERVVCFQDGFARCLVNKGTAGSPTRLIFFEGWCRSRDAEAKLLLLSELWTVLLYFSWINLFPLDNDLRRREDYVGTF